MKLVFKLDEWDEVQGLLRIKYPSMDDSYYVRVKDTRAYTVCYWRIVIPEYKLSLREGLQFIKGEVEDIIVFYNENEKRPSRYTAMYSGVFLETAVAYHANTGKDVNPECYIDTDEFNVKKYPRKKYSADEPDTEDGAAEPDENQFSLFDDIL